MAKVWEVSRHSGTQLLMLLAIADFADDDGIAWPSVATLAKKCRVKPRNASLLLAALRASGELEVLPSAGPQGVNRYRITCMEPLQKSAPPLHSTTPPQPLQPATSPPCSGLQSTPVAGCITPLQPATDKPSMNRQRTTKRTTSAVVKAGHSGDLPTWVPGDAWTAYVDNRREINKPLTKAGTRLAVRALEKLRDEGHDPRAVLERATLSNWLGLYPLKSPDREASHGRSFASTDYTAGIKAETTYQRSMRERMEQVAPSLAAKAPGAAVRPNPMDIIDAHCREVPRPTSLPGKNMEDLNELLSKSRS